MSRPYRQQSRLKEAARMAGIMPLTRELGELLPPSTAQVPVIQPIGGHIVRPNRKRAWGPEMWAEMQAIWNTPDPFEAGPIARRGNQESEFDDAN